MLPNTQSQNLLNCVRGKSRDRHAQEESDLIETLQNSKFESLIPNKPSSVLSSSGKRISIDQSHALKDQELAKSKRNISLDREHNVLKEKDSTHCWTEGRKNTEAEFKIFRHSLDGDKIGYTIKLQGRVLFKKKKKGREKEK